MNKSLNIFIRRVKRKLLVFLYPNLTIGYGTTIIGWPKISGSGKISIGKNCRLIRPVLKCDGTLQIRDNCFLNRASINAKLSIIIKDWAIISDAYIVDTDFHNLNPEERHKPLCKKAIRPILIEENVWIGDNCAILKGSHIQKGTVIGSNSVVRGQIPENCIALGNPVEVVKYFKDMK